MDVNALRRTLFVFGILLVLVLPGACSGQSYFGYRLRDGGYFEGVEGEQPISGIDLQLVSVYAIADDQAAAGEAVPGYLHLAFVVPGEQENMDITIRGPGRYLLNRVDREFNQGLNIFAWESRVVEGVGLSAEALEPTVAMLGGVYVPSIISEARPVSMPGIRAYRVSLQSTVEGVVRYFVRDGGKLIDEGSVPVSANVPADILLPATADSDHIDLVALLDFETDGVEHMIRQFYPIQTLPVEASATGSK